MRLGYMRLYLLNGFCCSLYQLTAEKLMEEYEIRMLTLRNTQAERRVNSLKRIAPANFTKEVCDHNIVSQDTLQNKYP